MAEDGERVLASGEEDAADVVARRELPPERGQFLRRRHPADVELVEPHWAGCSG
jgi:hypothetical protein